MPAAHDALPPATTIAAWRVLLRGAAAVIALYAICIWAAKGYHRGWSMNQVPITHTDPITEIAYVTYEKRFVPGLDYLGGGIFVGVLLFSATFLPARRPKA
jgi:hypothetical protein